MRGEEMKIIAVLFIAMILLFGCTAAPPQEPPEQPEELEEEMPPQDEPEEPPQEAEEKCEPAYAFSKLESAKLSESVQFSVTASCAGGKELSLLLDGTTGTKTTVPDNDPTVVNFDITASEVGTSTVALKSDGETIYAEDWHIAPLGSSDTSGVEYDQVSNKKWTAVAFEIENPVNIGSIGAYVRRLDSQTLDDSFLVYEIREDDGGEPAPLALYTSEISVDQTTMSQNWLYQNFGRVILDPGRYWVVLRVAKDEPTLVGDAIHLHYSFDDKKSEPDGDTMQMTLEWSDSERRWMHTEWELPAFDKDYALVVTSQEN
jgi:hypothetical protein